MSCDIQNRCCVRKNVIITDARNNMEQNFYHEFEQSLIEIDFEVSMMPYANDQPLGTLLCGYIAICSIFELIYFGSISRETLFGDPETTVNFFNSIINEAGFEAIRLHDDEILEIIKILEFIKKKSGVEVGNVRAAEEWYQSHRHQFDSNVPAPSWFAGVYSYDEFIEFATNTQQVEQVAILNTGPSRTIGEHWFAVKIDISAEHKGPGAPCRAF